MGTNTSPRYKSKMNIINAIDYKNQQDAPSRVLAPALATLITTFDTGDTVTISGLEVLQPPVAKENISVPPVSSSAQPEQEPPAVNQTLVSPRVMMYQAVQQPPEPETTYTWTEKLGFFACIVAFFGFVQSSIMESNNHADDLFGQCQADYEANENSWWKSTLLPCTYRDQPYIYGSAITTRKVFDNLSGISHAAIAIPPLLFGLGKLPFPFGT